MFIKEIAICNCRGVKSEQKISLGGFSSIIGQNDAGKFIVLNAIATFLDTKEHPISATDFNDPEKPIEIVCTFFLKISIL